MRSRTLSGSPKKNAALCGLSKYIGGSNVGLVATCQKAIKTRNSATCQRRNALLLLLGIAFQHFVLHCAPDQGMELDEARREADLGDVAWARQVDRELAYRPCLRAGREHHDSVRERDRLFQIVGDEHYRLAVSRPELEQLVLHQLPGLDVQRGKRFVHQDDLRIQNQ